MTCGGAEAFGRRRPSRRPETTAIGLRAEAPGDLDRGAADAAGGAVDQHVMPGARPARITSVCSTVKKVSGSAAPAAAIQPRGSGSTWPAGTATYSA